MLVATQIIVKDVPVRWKKSTPEAEMFFLQTKTLVFGFDMFT